MKNKRLIIIGLLVFVLFTQIAATILPPQLPSSFYGWIVGGTGSTVTVRIDGVVVAQSNISYYNGEPVYLVNVRTEGVPAGTMAIFYVDRRIAGIGYIYSGTSVRLDLAVKSINPVILPITPIIIK